MKRTTFFFRKYYRFVLLAFLFVGVLLIVLGGAVFKTLFWQSLFISLGTALFATILYSLVINALNIDFQDILQEITIFNQTVFDAGLMEIKNKPQNPLSDDISKARSIYVLSTTSKTLVSAYQKDIESAIIEHSCDVKVVLADPVCSHFENEDVLEGLCPATDVPSDITSSLKIWERIAQKVEKSAVRKKGSIEVHLYKNVPTCAIVIFDNTYLYYTGYLPYHNHDTPSFKIINHNNNSWLFQRFAETFQDVFENHSEKYI